MKGMKGKIIVRFKKKVYEKMKAGMTSLIKDEISMCSVNADDFANMFDDAENTMSFENAEIIFFSDMYAFKIFAAPKDKQLTRGYQIGKRYTIEINFSVDVVKSINNIKLHKALIQIRD